MKLDERIDCYANHRTEDIPDNEKVKDLISMFLVPGSLTFFGKKIMDSRYNPNGIKEKAICYFMNKIPEACLLDAGKTAGYLFLVKGLADLLSK